MKRGLLFSVLLLWAAIVQAGEAWDSLWRNADQQGERLMQQGKAAEAAQTYRDPRHKAYAELQAGDFADAAKHFAPFDDSNGDYNRGNALARAGQLQEAIKAYDAALAHDPNDQDARHNRDLVAKALQQQQSAPKPSSPNGSSSKDGKSGDKNQADQNGDKNQAGQSGSKDSGKQGDNSRNSSGNNASGQSPSGQPRSGNEQQGKTGQGKEGSGKEGSGKSGQEAGQGQQPSSQDKQSGQDKQPGASGQANGQPQSGDAEQAQRDAAAALGKSPTGKTGISSGAPISEQQLAREQWLRRIPDDPGGLLRRKFMIEHMIRQQGGQQ